MTKKELTPRFHLFDSSRGLAMILMAIYHFCFDLNHFQVLHQNMNYDPFWLNFRALIMTLFLSLVGISLTLANARFSSAGFKDRLKKIVGCALLITIVSYFMEPSTFIFFGILHFVAVASLTGPLMIRFPKVSLIAGIGFVLLPIYFRQIIFHLPVLNITGLSPLKPLTEDYAPLFPWLGVVWIGVFLGHLALKYRPVFLSMEIPKLSWLGQKSLIFYMTHQLVLFPLAWLISQFAW